VEVGAVISPEAKLSGNIKIGSGCVVHPKSVILAEGGPIEIGKNNIIEENCIIINRLLNAKEMIVKKEVPTMVIGRNNHFQVGSQIMALNIGDNNCFEIRSIISENVIVGNGCTIGMNVRVPINQKIEDNSILYGPQLLTHNSPESSLNHQATHSKHLELLHKIFRPPSQQPQQTQ